MAQLYVQRNAQPDTWVMSGAPTATTVFLSLDAAINYSDGTSDTLPANTLAVLPDATTVFDRTHDVYVCYTVQTSRVLSVIKESLLPTLTSAYAPLCRIEMHGIKPYQPEPYLAAGGLGNQQAQTVVAAISDASALALDLGVGGTPPANWYTTGFDDSAWAHAYITPDDASAGWAYIAGTHLTWANPQVTGADRALCRHHVTLPAGTITAATLEVVVDQVLRGLYVNGSAAGTVPWDEGSAPPFSVQSADVRALLVAGGSNLLAFYGENDALPADPGGNFSYKLTVTYAGADQSVAASGTPAEGDLLYYHNGSWTRLPAGTSGDELTMVAGDPAWTAQPADSDTSGTVTSVALSGPTGTTVSGSPVTASGTLSLSWASQSANTFLAAPNGSSGAPTFRALVAADVPNLPASQITSGQLAVARGGTGVDGSSASNGALLIGNGAGYTLATITAGSGISVTNSAGGIAIAATGGGGSGTVTSVALTVPGFLSVAGSPLTTSGTLAVTLATQNANTVFAGPSSGSAAAPAFRALQGSDLPAAAAAGGHIHAHGHFL